MASPLQSMRRGGIPLSALLLPLLLGGTAIDRSEASGRPNIVILYADDMGYGDLACQNPEAKLTTPNLDRLAADGVRFTDAHSSSGICSPSRFALLTGRYHWRRRHGIVRAMGPSIFRDGDVTLPMLLQKHGYRTACFGKWHLGWDWKALLRPEARRRATPSGLNKDGEPLEAADYDWSRPVPDGPCSVGFDEYFGDGTINFPPYCWIANDRVIDPPSATMTNRYLKEQGLETREGKWEFREGPMVAGWNPYDVLPTLANRVEQWIRRRPSEEPFFLYFALPSPHAPILPNDEFVGATNAGGYGDYVYQTDAIVGRALEALDAVGLRENTLVIFSSDNGPERYAFRRLIEYGHASSGQLRGVKRDVWEGGHRVPLLVRWPGHAPRGEACDRLVSQIDLFATIAAAVGVEVSDGAAADSLDITPLIESPRHSPPIRETLVHNTYANRWGIRHGDWLYIDGRTGSHTQPDAAYEQRRGYRPSDAEDLLFNLRRDLQQRINLSDEHRGVADRLREKLLGIRGRPSPSP